MDEKFQENFINDVSGNTSFIPGILDALPAAVKTNNQLLDALYQLEARYIQLRLENKELRDTIDDMRHQPSGGRTASVARISDNASICVLELDF